jgi:hypothetical protein
MVLEGARPVMGTRPGTDRKGPCTTLWGEGFRSTGQIGLFSPGTPGLFLLRYLVESRVPLKECLHARIKLKQLPGTI